jgi:hypothetical protein
MEAVFSKEVQQGLEAARQSALRRSSRLRLSVDGVEHAVLRMWKTGFAIAAENAPQLRGLVDLYDGSQHLLQCLIMKAEEASGEMHYEFKRATAVSPDRPLDFERPRNAPAGLITDGR